MESPAATADVGPLLVSAAFQLVGLVSGAALREATQLVVGSDPRRPRFWLTESLVVVVFSAALGVAVSFRLDLGVAGPPFAAGLTTFAALSGFHAFSAARTAGVPRAATQSAAHVVVCIVCGVLGFAGALIAAGGRG